MKNFFYILFNNKVTIIKAAYARLQMTQHPCNYDSIQTIDIIYYSLMKFARLEFKLESMKFIHESYHLNQYTMIIFKKHNENVHGNICSQCST